jgi:hypothetical protein
MLATGLAFWQTDAANYWGHNAIIRMRAFIDHCGLPTLPGKAPFGGDILSHDFVEAAMLRHCLRKLDNIGWPVVVASTHDEIIVQVEKGHEDEATQVMLDVMCKNIPGGDGLPIKAEATRWDWYTKCVE